MSDLTQAKAAFLDSLERYPRANGVLVKSCVAELERYTDPTEGRDRDIQRRASEAIAATQSTHRLQASLANGVSILLVQVNVHAGSMAVKMLNRMIPSLQPLRPEELSEVEGRMAWAVHLAHQSIMAATLVPDIRRTTLEEFSGEFSAQAISYLDALIHVTHDEQRTELVKALTALLVPGAAKLIAAAQFVDAVHQKAKALAHSYRGYGAEDKLFGFARRLEEENRLFDDVSRSISTATEAISAAAQTA
jgi:hypothetical protein